MRWPWVSRGRYDDLKEAHRREVDILVTWIEQLQTQVGALNSPRDPEGPQRLSDMPEMAMYISDEEEDLLDARQQGLIDEEQFQQAMAAIGRSQVEIG